MRSNTARIALYLAAAAAALIILYWLRYMLILCFIALLIAIFFDAAGSFATKFLRLPRGAAVIASACLLVVAVAATFALLAVPLMREGTGFVQTLKERSSTLTHDVEHWKREYPILNSVLPDLDSAVGANQASVTGTARKAWLTISNVLDLAAQALMVFFLALFLAWSPERWLQGIAELGPPDTVSERKALYRRIGAALRSYLFTYAIYIVAMGALWSVGLWLIGIDYFLVFGVLGGLVEVAPYIGPFIGLIPPLLMALLTAPAKCVYVLLLYAVLHVVEGYLLVPWLMHEREHLPAPVIMLSLMAFGTLFGTLGVLIAVPMGSALYVIANETIYSRRSRGRA